MPALLSSDAPNQPSNASQPNAQVATRWPSKLEVFASVDSMPNVLTYSAIEKDRNDRISRAEALKVMLDLAAHIVQTAPGRVSF